MNKLMNFVNNCWEAIDEGVECVVSVFALTLVVWGIVLVLKFIF